MPIKHSDSTEIRDGIAMLQFSTASLKLII